MNDPVKRIFGMGEKKAEELARHGVSTVGDLANVAPSAISMPGIANWIKRAQEYLQAAPQAPSQRRITVGGVPDAPREKFRYELKEHTWYKQVVSVPHPQNKLEDKKQLRVVVLELVVDPNERVSLLCAWVEEREQDGETIEVECTFTYSPVLIKHFNPQLDMLRCSMAAEDGADIPTHALTNAVWECDQLTRE